ncbi:MAG: NAD-dependent epimerase [Spirochaetaceae bacterium]|jgi:UDP-glucuronate 4-epimerase|nr:NAD-dependent epimerase [Spirochaetaceae bacterium]
MKILVTGTAGFIGFHLAEKLSGLGHSVTGIDNINAYYDTSLKEGRLKHSGIAVSSNKDGIRIASEKLENYTFIKMDLADRAGLFNLFEKELFDCVINLAAQAGVRYSLENPYSYIESNIAGFLNILEACRHYHIHHLIFASSSSVYGLNEKAPFSVSDTTDMPASLYAATKKSNELMAYSYSHLYQLPVTGLRFFTVYGPWGRPDMAPFLFTKAILEGKPIKVFNNGNMRRDFTYIDDIIEGIVRVIDRVPASPLAAYKIYNIGYGKPVNLMTFIEAVEKSAGKKAKKEMLPMQQGDVPLTWADTGELEADTGYRPKISIDEGVPQFVTWYTEYYQLSAMDV